MATDNRRLVVDHPFERTVVSVIDAFLREGFTITPLGGGDLRQHPNPGNPLRFAMLQAAHPDLARTAGARHAGGAPGLCCQIALYELVGRCTLVTAATPVTAAWLSDRLASALGAIARKASGTEAA